MRVLSHAEGSFSFPRGFLSKIPSLVKKVLKSEKRKFKGEVNVIFVDQKKIRQLNRQFLATQGDTDVIAFPYEDQGGDIYICFPVATANAKRFKEPIPRELTRLVIHGTLHLLGYADWPKSKRDIMWAKQEVLVSGVVDGLSSRIL